MLLDNSALQRSKTLMHAYWARGFRVGILLVDFARTAKNLTVGTEQVM